MRVRGIILAVVLTCLAHSRLVADEPAVRPSASNGSFTFAAIGDIPYEEEEFPCFVGNSPNWNPPSRSSSTSAISSGARFLFAKTPTNESPKS